MNELENLKKSREEENEIQKINNNEDKNVKKDEKLRKESLRDEARRLMKEALNDSQSTLMIKSSIDSFQTNDKDSCKDSCILNLYL